MGPFSTPWLTFLAWIVTVASVLGALVWAVWFFKPGEDSAVLENGLDKESEIAEAGPAEVGEGRVDEAQEVRVPFFYHR